MIATLTDPVSIRQTPSESGVVSKLADTLEERRAAFRLIYQNYLRAGLIEPNEHQLRVMPHHLLPTTNVFVAVRGGAVITTVTLIGDGDLGLPMESIYPEEVAAARSGGLFVGEVSCLASEKIPPRQFLPIFIQLTRLMAQHARAFGMDQFLITVHPRHGRFYRRLMGFEQIGEVKEYPTVGNAPAVAFCLDFAHTDKARPPCYEQYFGTPLPASELRPQPMGPDDLEFFRPLISTTNGCLPAMA